MLPKLTRIWRWDEAERRHGNPRKWINSEESEAVSEVHLMPQMILVAASGRIVGCIDEVIEDCVQIISIQGKYQHSKTIPWDCIKCIVSRVYLNRDNEETIRNS